MYQHQCKLFYIFHYSYGCNLKNSNENVYCSDVHDVNQILIPPMLVFYSFCKYESFVKFIMCLPHELTVLRAFVINAMNWQCCVCLLFRPCYLIRWPCMDVAPWTAWSWHMPNRLYNVSISCFHLHLAIEWTRCMCLLWRNLL